MGYPWYRGTGEREHEQPPDDLPALGVERHADPRGYLADQGLSDAVNIAIHLGQPLLLTGQPGTGKTQLAYSVAWELGFGTLLKFETKSTSTARDLFYTYDTLGRFHAAQTNEGSRQPLDYIRFNALGLAILRANPPETVRDLERPGERSEPERSVVLLDEIDKAPRDFPNDILNEIEGMYFRIPELGRHEPVTAGSAMRPIVILTSNSEKNLPEAFLRRCVYYHIPFPSPERLSRIVHTRLGELATNKRGLLNEAIELFYKLRDPVAGLSKTPSTGEFLAWLQALDQLAGESGGLRELSAEQIGPTLCALIKTGDDIPKAQRVVGEWQRTPKQDS